MIGCTRGSGRRNCDVVQGITYEVTAISNEGITLCMTEDFRRKESTAPREAGNDDAASNDGYDDVGVIDVFNAKEEIKVEHQDVTLLLGMSHALCYYSAQGRTLRDEHIMLLDTENPYFSRRALIVGMSRATHGKYVHVATAEQECAILGARRRVRSKHD